MAPNQSYIIPYTVAENNRLDQQHEIFVRLFKEKLHLCPYKPSENALILDVGTGSGSWAKYFVATHQGISLIGFDISPLLPSSIPRCLFRNADFHQPWEIVTQELCNFIHARLLFSSIRNINFFVKEAWDRLKPGGYVEFHEIEFPFLHKQTIGAEPIKKWCRLMQEGAIRHGVDLQSPRRYAAALHQAGFVDVYVDKQYTLLIGEWSNKSELRAVGKANRENIFTGLDGFSRILFMSDEKYKLTEAEYYTVLNQATAALRDDSLQVQIQVYVIWARKPEATVKAPRANL